MPANVRFSCPETFYPNWTTHYCPGCGHGNIHKYIGEAIADFDVQDRSIFVSSVGCSVFAHFYLDVGNVHVPHGRCPAVATALKRAHPDSLVLGYQGNGDLAAIGGNEILHAASRGENLTIFFLNNAVYGLTGGQTTTTLEGRRAPSDGLPIRVSELLNSLDAPYYLERVAVGDPKHNHKARRAIRKAIENQLDNRGFSLIEILSPCPTSWKMKPVEAARRALDEMTRTFPLGVFRDGHSLDLGHPRRRRPVSLEAIPELLEIGSGESCLALPPDTPPVPETRIKISGFGGQGVLLLGKILAEAGMLAGLEVSWLPAYGPEMRGGTANCSVTLSGREIGSPLIENPTHLVAMNGPSFERFGPDVAPGGVIFLNSSMIDGDGNRDDVASVRVPANAIANELGDPRVANAVMLGALLGHGGLLPEPAIRAALADHVGADPELRERNEQALVRGALAGRGVER